MINENRKLSNLAEGDDALESRVRSLSQYQQTMPRDFGVFAI